MLAAARRHGMVSYQLAPRFEDVLRELSAGNPVIVLQNLGFGGGWHYAVAVGYDYSYGELILRSGITERETLPFGIHEFLWKRSGYWAMVAVPPDRIPATADELRWLASIAALERAGDAGSARTAYAGFLKRWPGNINAAVGLANAHHALGELPQAEAVLRQAERRDPASVVVLNNLAQTLSDQGRNEEALPFIERAADRRAGDLLRRQGRAPAELEHGGAFLEGRLHLGARCVRDQRDDDVRVGSDFLQLLKLGRDRLAGPLAQSLAQQREQHQLAQRHAPVRHHQSSELREEAVALLLLLRLDRRNCKVGKRQHVRAGNRLHMRSEPVRLAGEREYRGLRALRLAQRLAQRRRQFREQAGGKIDSLRNHIAGVVEHCDFPPDAMPRGTVVIAQEARMHAADALLDRRVRREAPPARNREGEEHVRKLLAMQGEHRGGRAHARIESSAPAIASGLRVNCTLAASARNSRCREIAALMASAARLPGKPMNATTAPKSAARMSAPRSSLGRSLNCQAVRYTSFSPCSLNHVSPARMPTSRRLSAMSPLRRWLNS